MTDGVEAYLNNSFFRVSDRLQRYLGTATLVAGVAGSVTDARFAQGTPWWVAVESATGYPQIGNPPPVFSFNAGTNTLSWTAATRSMTIRYGVY